MATLVDNRKATFSYEVQDKYEAGIELFGFEVKSLKNKRGNLSGSYIVIRGGEAFLIGLDIPPYQANNMPDDYDQMRPRKLLLTKKELDELADLENEKGLTLVPISLYNKGRVIKLEFAVGRGKKTRDKRETIKRREADREIHRTLKKLR
ncbi:MAG: SsrA-binding protein SmpB [Bacteriovoracia bacterium]